jgi:hypothetical protein
VIWLEFDGELHVDGRAEAQINVVPGDGGVSAGGGGGAGNGAGVAMALDDLAAGVQRDLVERIGELA